MNQAPLDPAAIQTLCRDWNSVTASFEADLNGDRAFELQVDREQLEVEVLDLAQLHAEAETPAEVAAIPALAELWAIGQIRGRNAAKLLALGQSCARRTD